MMKHFHIKFQKSNSKCEIIEIGLNRVFALHGIFTISTTGSEAQLSVPDESSTLFMLGIGFKNLSKLVCYNLSMKPSTWND